MLAEVSVVIEFCRPKTLTLNRPTMQSNEESIRAAEVTAHFTPCAPNVKQEAENNLISLALICTYVSANYFLSTLLRSLG